MKTVQKRSGENNMFILLLGILITGLIYFYRLGILGNDFWWHVKAGEWMVNNRGIPYIDVFSWFAKENDILWVSHEWLSDVFFYVIHAFFGDIGIFILSLFSAIGMSMLIVIRNKHGIKINILLSLLYLIPIIGMFPTFFYGRPQLISYFLLYGTLYCLYRYKEDESTKSIYFVPFISLLWSNFHGGSSTLPYILCFIFMFSGIFKFSIGKLDGEKLSKRQLRTYLVVGILSILTLVINPHGLQMLTYPFANMGDSFMQSVISEWASPDAKELPQLFSYFLPLVVVGISLIITDKKIRIVDLLIFLFFTYMFFRSARFSILFFIASTFFSFRYFIPREVKPMKTKLDSGIFYMIIVFFIATNIFSIFTMFNTFREGKIISVVLDMEFIELIKEEEPERLFNDYNFGETLIYNDISTFVDGRADVFSQYNLHDAISLLLLKQTETSNENKIFNPEDIIEKYNFDAFLIDSERSLAVYLKSNPEKYELLLEDGNAVYFKVVSK
jgi:hypothetical protein